MEGEEVMLEVRLVCRPTIETTLEVSWNDWRDRRDEAALESLRDLIEDSVGDIAVRARVDTIDVLELTDDGRREVAECNRILPPEDRIQS